MKPFTRCALVLGVFGCGYLAGSVGFFSTAEAQVVSDEAENSIKQVHQSLSNAVTTLETEQRYVAATEGVNSFAVLVGGVNAMNDLDDGRGVDPETFAGLYSGRALPEVKRELARDENGRLTYRGQVIRMYSPSRLTRLFSQRDSIKGSVGN